MEHCFDTGPILQISSLYSQDNLCIIDPLSELIANITKQLIQNTSGCFVDIGAYRGKWADYVHNNCPDITRRIYLYEPSYTSYSLLKTKYKSTTRIQFHNLAISSSCKGLQLIDDDQSSRIYNPHEDTLPMYSQLISVPAIKYDAIFKNKRAAIVKIRTNGHEISVLSGMQEAMQEDNVDSIIFECSPMAYGFYDDEMYIYKYLRSLKQRFSHIYIIDREYLTITICNDNNTLNEAMHALNLLDTFDIVCCTFPLQLPNQKLI